MRLEPDLRPTSCRSSRRQPRPLGFLSPSGLLRVRFLGAMVAATAVGVFIGALLLPGCGGKKTVGPPPPGRPRIRPVGAIRVSEEETREITVTATDPDGDHLVLSASRLPSFASFLDNGDGTGLLRLAPLLSQAGTYPDIELVASDGTLADSVRVSIDVDELPRIDGALFYEPVSVCATGADSKDSLSVYNLADQVLYWRALRVPDGIDGMNALVRVAPKSVVSVPWRWNPPGPYPVEDSLLFATNDRGFPRATIPFHRQDPRGGIDITPPDAPLLAVPSDGARFVVHDSVLIQMAWSQLDDCSGIQYYKLDISTTPDFSRIVCCRKRLSSSVAEVWAYPSDAGKAYWRVSAVDNQGLHGPFSEVRSWTVELP